MATPLSRQKKLYQLTVTIPAIAEEPASAVIESLFAQWPISFTEPESGITQLSLFLAVDHPPSKAQLSELGTKLDALNSYGIPVGNPTVRVARLANRNWKHSWKRHFKPLQIGRHLLLRPSWSKRRAMPGQSLVVLDPGLSFGTGQHPTTSFCLRELVNARKENLNPSLLDIGTGSGILAIAAAKLGYTPVHGFDYDPDSIRVAGANARRNRVDHKIRFRRQDLSTLPARGRQKWDVVCANLLADLLTQEAGKILNRVKPGGVLVIAGILSKEFNTLDQHFTALGVQPIRTRTEGEWRSGSYRVPA